MGNDLRTFDIKYLPCTTINGQVLADLVEKFTKCPRGVVITKGKSAGIQVTVVIVLGLPLWKLYIDGVAN